MNIIIPIGGLGERFKLDEYTKPKPLIPIFGKQMIFHVLDNLILHPNDQIIIIYSIELIRHDFKDIILSKYPTIQLIELTKNTDGAVETVLFGLDRLHETLLNRRCVLLDCDTFYTTDILTEFRNKPNDQNAIFCFKDIHDKPIYSYIEFPRTMPYIISNIKEKVRISDYANSGCYCFSDGLTLQKYCRDIINTNTRERGEFYTSCVIAKMLEDGHRFDAIILNEKDIICVGTPMQLKIYASNYKKCEKSEKKRFCFDLDGTLVSVPNVPGDYSTVQPIKHNISILVLLKSLGHYIIIHTARRMKTHRGNIGKVIQDIGKITFETLAKFNIPYDEIYFGKPYADFYIDDRAVSATANLEKELGFYSTNMKERDFNEIQTDSMDIIIKRSNNNIFKIQGEIHWYLNMPAGIQNYFPRFLNHGIDWYSMEKISGLSLSYLYVNQSFTPEQFATFLNIFHEIHKIHCVNYNEKNNIYELYLDKIRSRYKTYNYSKFPKSDEIYNKLITFFEKYENSMGGQIGIIHGDPVFTNCILTKNNEFKIFDMRGMIGSNLTIYGDIYYDYAKIYQSLIGYDEIILGKSVSSQYREQLLNVFLNFLNTNYDNSVINKIIMITNSLLFTLIPLHDNENCQKFYELIMDM